MTSRAWVFLLFAAAVCSLVWGVGELVTMPDCPEGRRRCEPPSGAGAQLVRGFAGIAVAVLAFGGAVAVMVRTAYRRSGGRLPPNVS
ncbi:hypothetical protein ACFTTN_06495 [Streptomyces niveus]|uniref:hypothetical protein n=1 Tax=Streptomyces niveus TaxID=193462 RepID=UPI003635EF6C